MSQTQAQEVPPALDEHGWFASPSEYRQSVYRRAHVSVDYGGYNNQQSYTTSYGAQGGAHGGGFMQSGSQENSGAANKVRVQSRDEIPLPPERLRRR